MIERASQLLDDQRDDAVPEFITLLGTVTRNKDPRALPGLFRLLRMDESSPRADLMWTVIHTLEAYPSSVYLDGLVTSLVSKTITSAYWLNTLLARVANSENERSEFKRLLANETETRRRLAISEIGRASAADPQSASVLTALVS